MKKYLIPFAILLSNVFFVHAQTPTMPTEQKAVVTQNVLSKPTEGDDKGIFSGYFSGVLNMVGNDGKSGIQLSTTLYTITHFKQIAHNDTLVFIHDYQRQWWLRNIQINCGFTPDNKNQIEVDGLSYGLKFAVLNNKHFSDDEIDSLTLYTYLKTIPVIDYIEKYKFDHPADAALLQEVLSGKLKLKDAPKNFQDAMIKNFKVKDINVLTDFLDPDTYYKTFVKKLKTKPLLTLSANSNYNELKSQANNYVASATYAFYIKNDTTKQWSLTLNHTWGADTATYKGGLVRNISELTAGLDFSIAKWLEFKPGLDYVNTLGPLYKKENKNTGNITATPRIKINKNFWIPVTFKYNAFQNGAHVQGQFTVQYSLK